ncbi:solute carrier organic anion transporter family member 3A1-like [Patiria miniata]|uniref:Solute carrier organic anion transporter family member n=1 Tax=Patiria miniata TaxID=46514 RepID=A0A913ZIG5_PATMI|nr:solute carrier organic anion transporter family member 3A1-like [Patiria miniata]
MSQTKDRNGSLDPKYQELPTQEQNGNFDNVIMEDVLDDKEDAHAQCGLGALRCRCLQVFAHPNAYVLLVGLMFMSTIGANGVYVAGVISTIEKRFQLKSSESALLLSFNDVSSLSGVLFVAHFGGRSHRPRIIGISCLLVALGSFLNALPQFIYDNPALDEIFVTNVNQSEQNAGTLLYEKDFTCNAQANATPCTAEEIEASGSQLAKTWPIILGQLLSGVGTSAIIPLSVTYVDDAVEKAILPIYMALMFLPMAITPLFGFAISGYCLSLFVDFYKTDVSELGLTPRDPQWQGAWWLGFIIYGCLLCLIAVPFFFFPRKLRKPKTYFFGLHMPDCCKTMIGRGPGRGGRGEGGVAMAQIATHHKKHEGQPILVALKEFVASLWRLLTNPIFMTSLMGYCMLVIAFSGFGFFCAKYMQYQFGISPVRAGLLLGFTVMPGSLIGIMLGGVVSSRAAGSQRGYAKLTIGVQVLCVLGYGSMMALGCPNIDIAGLTTQYGAGGHVTGNNLDVFSSCNMDCSCEKGVYSPVCGSDNITYVTACFAGCKAVGKDEDDITIYEGCTCINQTGHSSLNEPASGSAFQGACASNCDLLLPFIIILGVTTALSSMSFNPTFMMKFRSVLDKDRDLSLGLTSLFSKILGFIPAPIILGAGLESQCSYWQESCDATGECLEYDRPGLRFVFTGFAAGFRLLASLFFCIGAFFIYRASKYEQAIDNDEVATANGKSDANGGMRNVEKTLSSTVTDV